MILLTVKMYVAPPPPPPPSLIFILLTSCTLEIPKEDSYAGP